MKKTIVSLAAAAALTSGAFAADKGIDIVTTGQAVVYYQTVDRDVANDAGFFDQANSSANVGLQLDLAADLKNDFTFGAQLTYLGTAGLEKNLVSGVMQANASTLAAANTDELALTQIYVAKKIANTTVKLGRQELPMALSPLAYSEDWNVFKNTFDAVVAVNTDIPNTVVVAAYVSGSNKHTAMSNMTDLAANGLAVVDGAYMLTAQTTVIPMTTLTASYYTLHNVAAAGISADAYWVDAKVADASLPMSLTLGAQYGNINPDSNIDDTTAYGFKASLNPMPELTLAGAYTNVDDTGLVTVTNVGTGVKSPLYTQMVGNQASIAAIDNDTWMLKASYSLGDMGALTAQYAATNDATLGDNDLNELDLLYTVSYAGVDYLAAYVSQDYNNAVDQDIIRLWARYNF